MNYNGYTLKAVKMAETPRGISYGGNIYYSGKKIGTTHNEGNGDMTEVSLLPDNQNHYEVLNEEFVEMLFTLNDYEEMFKEEMKNGSEKGMAFVTYTDPFDLKGFSCNKDEPLDEIVLRIQNASPEQEIKSVEVFRSPEDFNITPSCQPELFLPEPDQSQGMNR